MPRLAPRCGVLPAIIALAITSAAGRAADSVVVFNEIQYHPPGDDPALEFVELYNQCSVNIDLTGWRISGGIDFAFPDGTAIPRDGYLVIAADPAALGIAGALGPFSGQLDNGGERLRLRNINDRIMDEVDYNDAQPWPEAADGSGASLSKIDPLGASAPPENWRHSWEVGGTPGDFNFAPLDTGGSSGGGGSGGGQTGEAAFYFPFDGDAQNAAGGAAASLTGGGFESGAPTAPGGSASLALDGAGDFASAADTGPQPTGYTISAWVRPDAIKAQSIITRTSPTGPTLQWSHQIRMTADGRFEHYAWHGAPLTVTGATVAQAGQWYHLAATAGDNGTGHLFVNGVEEGIAGPVTALWNGGDRWNIGSNSGNGMGFFQGRIAHAAIWRSQYGASYIAQLAAGALTPLEHNTARGKVVISGSGAYNVNPFNIPFSDTLDFTAGKVTDGSIRDVFGANYWLGRDSTIPERFTVDLGEDVDIAQIHLRNTHNTQHNDRGTASFRITASSQANAALEPDGGAVILSGTLDARPYAVSPDEVIPAQTFTPANGLSPGVRARYLMFETLTANYVGNHAGLNEFEVYGTPTGENTGAPDGGGGDPGGGDEGKGIPLAISEIGTEGAGAFFAELQNFGGSTLDLSGMVVGTSDGAGEFALPDGTMLGAGARLALTEADLGFAPTDGERLVLYTAGKAEVIDGARFDPDSIRARLESDPAGRLYAAESATPGASNAIAFDGSVVINEIMYHHRPDYGTPPIPPSFAEVKHLPGLTQWRYEQSGANLGTAWRAKAFDDSSWQTGFAALGVENAGLETPLATNLLLGQWSYYFRKRFTYTGAADSELILRTQIDDGCVIYVDGIEIYRFNMPGGDPIRSTAATTGVGDAVYVETVLPPGIFPVGEEVVIAAEVHQASAGSTDVVFAMEIIERAQSGEGVPGTPFVKDDEEWIELYNRSAEAADLTGAKLRGGISYDFAGGTVIPAGGYLVVAKDAAALAAKYPGAAIVGNFDGSLNNDNDQIELRGANGNPMDFVHYRDNQPWPQAADGGGASLELRDPDADNAEPEAWAASDEASRSEWQTYSLRGVATNPRFSPNIYSFHELRLGLLDAGEVLIDDLQVIENPGGAARPLLQNGTFANLDHWRLYGTHEESSVALDGGNPVLHLKADGRMTYLLNLLETSLKSGGSLVPVTPGTEYEITFRAKWLSGTPQLRFELYYNKLARLAILEQPAESGTPGAPNSRLEPNIGPTFAGLRHDPPVPGAGEPITVSVRPDDPDGIASIALRYAVNEGAFENAAMAADADGVWRGEIPGQAPGAIIQFYCEASDTLGAAAFAPAQGPDSRALIQVQDQRAGGTDKQNLRLIMLPSDVADLHDPDDILSNRRRPLTAILNESEIAYDCGMRLRGSMFSRQNAATTGLNIQLPSDQPFRGSIPTITVRRAGLQEVVVKHIIARSGGIPNSYNDVVYLAGHTAAQTGIARLEMARFGTAWAEGAYPDGGDGTVFKMEGIREFQATLDGNPESRKKPFNPIGWVPAFDLADQGDDRETYRHNLRINSNFDKDDYGAIIQMAKLFSLTGAEMEARAPEVIDVDAWMRQFALLSLCGIGDTYSQGNPHNLNFYVRPADGKVIPMPWDWDFTFNRPTDGPLWGNRNLANLIQIPQFNRLFLGHLRDLINTSFNTGYMDPWLAHFNACAGTQTTAYSNYIAARGAYVLTQLPAAVAFAITTNGGADFSVGDSFVDLEGSGWIDVREIRLANGTALAVDWLDADSWRLRVPLSPGANAIALTAIDFQGNAVGTASINVSNSGSVARASAEFLAVRELHFHPADDAATEFVELANLSGSLALDLTGVAFSAGIDFAFPDGFQIPAGGRAVVVQDAAAFAAEYGAGLPVAGEFANATRLANGGERIALADAFGAPIADFTFGDAFPWPAAADGGGYSAVLIAGGDPGDPLDWRHSALPGGSPGVDDADPAPADPLADADRDGLPAFAEAALGRSDGDGSDAGIGPAVWIDAEGHLNVAFIRHLPAESARLAAEASADLIDWSVPLDYTAEVPNGDGTATVTWRSTEPFTAAEAFGAVRAESRE